MTGIEISALSILGSWFAIDKLSFYIRSYKNIKNGNETTQTQNVTVSNDKRPDICDLHITLNNTVIELKYMLKEIKNTQTKFETTILDVGNAGDRIFKKLKIITDHFHLPDF